MALAVTATIHPDALAEFMRTEGIGLTDLAGRADVSVSYLSEIRSGTKRRVSPAVAKRLADALGVRVAAITVADPDAEAA